MKHLMWITCVFALLLGSVPGVAQTETPNVIQLFGCNLHDGKTYDNVWSTLEAFSASLPDTNPDPGFSTFLWLPARGINQYDYVFGAFHTDLVAMADGGARYTSTATFPANQLRFAELGECDSVLGITEFVAPRVGDGAGGDRQMDGMLETFRCTLRDGSTRQDLRGAAQFWKEQFVDTNHAAVADYGAFMVHPLRGGPGNTVLWVGYTPNMQTWAKGQAAMLEAPANATTGARFAEHLSNCQSSMWRGFWLRAPQQ